MRWLQKYTQADKTQLLDNRIFKPKKIPLYMGETLLQFWNFKTNYFSLLQSYGSGYGYYILFGGVFFSHHIYMHLQLGYRRLL